MLQPVVCTQVEGCVNDMTSLRPFYQRLRICGERAAAAFRVG